MNYENMNIYDKASIIKNLIEDEYILFIVSINGISVNICDLEVSQDAISIIISHGKIDMEQLKKYQNERQET
jgi:hypothetical protein